MTVGKAMNIKHICKTGKSKTLKSKQNPGKPGSKLKKRLQMKGGIVSKHLRLKKQKTWLKG